MKTFCFDAEVDFAPLRRDQPLNLLLLFRGKKVSAVFYFYETDKESNKSSFFVRVQLSLPLMLRWKDRFNVQDPAKKSFYGKGSVLNPFSKKTTQKKEKNRTVFLKELQGDEKVMILALVKEKSIRGLWEKEIRNFSFLSRNELISLCKDLESECKIKIFSFSPLFIISQEAFYYLCQKILTYLSKFHKKHPHELGISLDRITKRYRLNPRVQSLTITYLFQKGKIKRIENLIALSNFDPELLPKEENILCEMEEMCLKGEIATFSLEDLKQHFSLTSQGLKKMLSLLIERKKVIKSKEGFIINSVWLDEVIEKIRCCGKRELTVSEFKNMTGLSRKYAIPLLELLDGKGVTRKRGALREIL